MPAPALDPPSSRRRWAVGILAGLVVVLLAVAVAIAALAPSDASGYGPEVEERFVGWCQRAGGEVDGEADADSCLCAYRAIAASVPFERFEAIDDALRDSDDLPDDVAPLVAGCVGDAASGRID